MGKFLACSVALLAFAVPVANANAQNGTQKWSGFYAGPHVGLGLLEARNTAVSAVSNSAFIASLFGPFFGTPVASLGDDESFIAGGQIGYNFLIGSFIFGIEGDLSGSTAEQTSSETRNGARPFTTELDHEVEWLATIRGRIGFEPVRSLLVYGTGGVAFAGVDSTLTYSNNSASNVQGNDLPGSFVRCAANSVCFQGSDEGTLTGWTAGGGFEYALSDTISVKGEYLFVDLGSHNVRAVGTDPGTTPDNSLITSIETELHVGRIGLNFHFN